jgi:thioester reductase-like protein
MIWIAAIDFSWVGLFVVTGGAAAGGLLGTAIVDLWLERSRRKRAAALVAFEARANADRLDEAFAYHQHNPHDSGWLSRITSAVSTAAWDQHGPDVALVVGAESFERIEWIYGMYRRHQEAWADFWPARLRMLAGDLEEHAFSRRRLAQVRATRAELEAWLDEERQRRAERAS